MFQIVFLTHMGRNLEILFKRIYWQVLLQKAIDNRTMMICHPAFAGLFHRLDQDDQELALLYLLLSVNGVWSIVTVGYLTGDDVRMRWEIQKLKSIQVANIDLEFYKAQRSKFTTEEWIGSGDVTPYLV